MIKPKFVQIPDFSNYIGKEFVFEEKFKQRDSNISFCQGMRFKIQKIDASTATIKIVSTIEECMPAIEDFAAICVKNLKSDIKVLDKIIKIWTEEADQFKVDKNNFWNKDGGHTINTGHNVPKDHPDKGDVLSDDDINTFNYIHKGGKKNYYSYQQGTNEWYSKTCYEFMRLGKVEDMMEFETLNAAKRKDIYNSYYAKGFLSKHTLSVKELNKGKFKPSK